MESRPIARLDLAQGKRGVALAREEVEGLLVLAEVTSDVVGIQPGLNSTTFIEFGGHDGPNTSRCPRNLKRCAPDVQLKQHAKFIFQRAHYVESLELARHRRPGGAHAREKSEWPDAYWQRRGGREPRAH
eukprot:CAMPEP_0180089630 /NCGR_PEP_ID=MMETSP0985-20121206/22919_1 /TAXON_ID=483367 /ORGANISM="non described non described, Strain CCMP 2436" /LENGTH=129 /DNA_ID=CAMNT_0022024215 /DNA_START=139 /DNA_END=528 /DNA_ORIENTATION=+